MNASILQSLIDLAGSERATSDKERTREGKYINTRYATCLGRVIMAINWFVCYSLLTLGSVIATLAENSAKGKTCVSTRKLIIIFHIPDLTRVLHYCRSHVPFRNSKLTRLLQPSLSGNARISVICTINPEPTAVAESLSTLGFARRVRGVKVRSLFIFILRADCFFLLLLMIGLHCSVQLNAQKKEVVDTEALLQRYRKEIEDLKKRLEERVEAAEPRKGRRLSEREVRASSPFLKFLLTRDWEHSNWTSLAR